MKFRQNSTVLRWFNDLNNYSHPNCQLIQFADETLILSYGKRIDQGKNSFESSIANLFKYFNKKNYKAIVKKLNYLHWERESSSFTGK